jgi:hypothetical protein
MGYDGFVAREGRSALIDLARACDVLTVTLEDPA